MALPMPGFRHTLEKVNAMFENICKNEGVLITGDNGVMGVWLAIWLKELGADIIGYYKCIKEDV